MRFVLDNSVVMRWLFADGSMVDRNYAAGVLALLEDPDNGALTPSVWPLEVANVIARAEAKGLLAEAQGAEFIGLLERMAIQVETDTAAHALENILQLARRFALSAYDASYLDLAMREGLPLASLGGDLRRAAEKTSVPLLPVS